MGLSTSSCLATSVEEDLSSLSRWKEMPDLRAAQAAYICERTIEKESTISELELRALLDEKIAIAALHNYARKIQKLQVFDCWGELKRFDSVEKYRREKLRSLCEKYSTLPSLRTPTPEYNCIAESKKKLDDIAKVISEGVSASDVLAIAVGDVRRCVFMLIHDLIFLSFKETPEYHEMCTTLTECYNGVSEDDFECFDEIGEGASALVLHCRKRSTGQDYAMKIQPKYDLLKCCGTNKAKVIQEVKAYTQCKHPYVTSLAYAFQTETLAVLVMPVALCGDLRRSLGGTLTGRMPVERVRFYAAEIAVALHYLHSHGIIYRDLKPGNVLLNIDGHVMLGDFGSVADCAGKLEKDAEPGPDRVDKENCDGDTGMSVSLSLSMTKSPSSARPAQGLGHVFDASQDRVLEFTGISASQQEASKADAPSPSGLWQFQASDKGLTLDPSSGQQQESVRTPDAMSESISHSGGIGPRRTKSIVGTLAYMAPEVIALFGLAKNEREGYTHAVDWWGLGCTIYTLLLGKEPFQRVSYDRLRIIFPALLLRHNNDQQAAHAAVFGTVDYDNHPETLTPDVVALIKALLSFDPTTRLGGGHSAGQTDLVGLYAHPFFEEIDWAGIETKTCVPPYLPMDEILPAFRKPISPAAGSAQGKGHTLPEMLRFCSKEHWLAEEYREQISGSKKKGSGGGVGGGCGWQGAVRQDKNVAKVVQAPVDRRIGKYRIATKYQEHFRGWNYASPEVIVQEVAASVRKASGKSTTRHSTLRGSLSVTNNSWSAPLMAQLGAVIEGAGGESSKYSAAD